MKFCGHVNKPLYDMLLTIEIGAFAYNFVLSTRRTSQMSKFNIGIRIAIIYQNINSIPSKYNILLKWSSYHKQLAHCAQVMHLSVASVIQLDKLFEQFHSQNVKMYVQIGNRNLNKRNCFFMKKLIETFRQAVCLNGTRSTKKYIGL